MANLLNAIIANQSLNKPNQQVRPSSFTFDTKGKIKPLEDKAVLLPSRIFGSPIEYAKDFKKDIVSIGKAAKGKANDHELGRINDLAMKLGSLGLASYLFVKNPLKLSKAMEFVGFGTFFASMALWPKLFIQAPLKARTGVDIHQKYIDSQGRKKMLHQDPQYDLTDLYSRKDLDKMGKKLGVSENLPDRDSFIKQRAKKTAIQGNTLWMMTAGLATPIMSALGCNLAEQPLTSAMEKFDLSTTQKAMDKLAQEAPKQGFVGKIKQNIADFSLNSFLKKNADKPLDEAMIKNLSARLGASAGSPTLQSAIADELKNLSSAVVKDESFLTAALAGKKFNGSNISEILGGLSDDAKTALNNALSSGSNTQIAKVLSQNISNDKNAQKTFAKNILQSLDKTKVATKVPTIAEATEKIKQLDSSLKPMSLHKRIIDKFIEARVGEKGNTYISNQWAKTSKDIIKGMKLTPAELKSLAKGDGKALQATLERLVSTDADYEKVVTELVKSIVDYEQKTGSTFTKAVELETSKMSQVAADSLSQKGFTRLAEKLAVGRNSGTMERVINNRVINRAEGAQSSFYRVLQTLEVFKKAQNGELEKQLTAALTQKGKVPSQDVIKRLVGISKEIMTDSCTTDHIEKLTELGLSPEEYKKVLATLFDKADDTIERVLAKQHPETSRTMLTGFAKYKESFVRRVAGWKNEMTKDLEKYLLDPQSMGIKNPKINNLNGTKRSTLVGKQTKEYFQEAATKTFNSAKWKKIFGIAGIALAVATVTATFFIGRKTKIEKQLEEEGKGKVNG